MKKKPLKTFLLLLISGLALTTLTILACGGGDWDGTEGSMFTPEIINQPKNIVFFRTLATPFYDGYDEEMSTKFNLINATEWISYFENNINDEAINYWLYNANLNQIDSMIFTLKNKPSNLSEKSLRFSLKNTKINSSKAISFLYYLGYAKRNETFANKTNENSWDTEIKKPVTISIEKQILGGLNFYNKASDLFLKERYAFQIIRLYFFNNDYAKSITFYTENNSLFTTQNSMKWRSMSYAAASFYKQKKFMQSNYLYSILFKEYEPLKKSSYLSFHPLQNIELSTCLALTKNTKEKEVIWQLQGLYTDDVLAMKEIIKLNPTSEEVDLLLVRAINKEEEKFEGITINSINSKNKPDRKIDSTLLSFLNTMSENKSANNPAIWSLGAAYLNYLSKNYSLADNQLKRAEKLSNTNSLIKSQFHLISALGKILQLKTIDEKTEKVLLSDLKQIYSPKSKDEESLRYFSAQQWMRLSLATLYIKNGQLEKAELIYPGSFGREYNDTSKIQMMIRYFDNKEKSAFENLFSENAILKKDDYLKLLAIRYAQYDLLESSIKTFKLISETDVVLYGNPFMIHIKDCHDCDHLMKQAVKYTSLKFIEKMNQIKNIAISKPEEAAQNYFLLANGFYNITYFGNARLFYDNRVDNTIYNYEHQTTPEENCALAEKYYLLAKEKSKDKEFKAKCTFMAAKCEQNRFYTNDATNYVGDFKSGSNFALLKKEYSSTKYYSEIIKECGYFKTYLGN